MIRIIIPKIGIINIQKQSSLIVNVDIDFIDFILVNIPNQMKSTS